MTESNTTESNHIYSLVMAGGKGSRLSPYSDRGEPKHLLSIDTDKTLIQETVKRIQSVLPHCFISTTEALKGKTANQLPGIPVENFIAEPESHNTLAAIAYNCLIISLRDPEAIIASIPSDHTIKNPLDFNQATLSAIKAVESDPAKIVFLGVTPRRPDTGLGYIEGQKTTDPNIYQIKTFREKPDLATAKKYLQQPNFFWNTANYFFKASTLLDLINQYQPQTFQVLEQIKTLINSQDPEYLQKIHELYLQIPQQQIADAIFEQPSFNQGIMMSVQTEWTDLGTWKSIYDFFIKNKKEYQKKPVKNFNLQNHRCLILNNTDQPVTTLGLRNILVVNTPTGSLVVHQKELPNINPHLKTFDQNPIILEQNNKNCQISNTTDKPILVFGLKNILVQKGPEGLTVIKKSKLKRLKEKFIRQTKASKN